jgi:LEA14-like dessication related protein
MRSLISLLCLSWLLAFTGCGTPPERRLDPPAIQITEVTASQDTYKVTLRVSNANTVPLVVNSSTHTLRLGQDRIGRIDDREPIGLPPLGAVPHTFTLTTTQADEVRAYLAAHPGEVRATVESAFEVLLTDDQTITLKSTGGGAVNVR